MVSDLRRVIFGQMDGQFLPMCVSVGSVGMIGQKMEKMEQHDLQEQIEQIERQEQMVVVNHRESIFINALIFDLLNLFMMLLGQAMVVNDK